MVPGPEERCWLVWTRPATNQGRRHLHSKFGQLRQDVCWQDQADHCIYDRKVSIGLYEPILLSFLCVLIKAQFSKLGSFKVLKKTTTDLEFTLLQLLLSQVK